MMHRLLARQLKQLGCSETLPPSQANTWKRFLDLVAQTYAEIEHDLEGLQWAVDVPHQDKDTISFSPHRVRAAVESGDPAPPSEIEPLRDVVDCGSPANGSDLFSPLIGEADEGMVILCPNRRVLSVNSAFTRKVGYCAEDVIGKETLFFLEDCGAEQYRSIWSEVTDRGRWKGPLKARCADGGTVQLHMSLDTGWAQSGQIAHYVVTVWDPSELTAARGELEQVGTHDALTGLSNRALFYDRLADAINRSRRSGRSGALLFVDLDRFKSINDKLGHHAGDELLVQVAVRVRSATRKEDLVARIGGDEFAVVVEDLTDATQAAGVARKLNRGLKEPFTVGGFRFSLTASIGISIFPDEGTDSAMLLKQADLAMYAAKQQGGNRFQYHLPEISREAEQRARMEAGLRVALEREEFALLYQPQYELASGELVSVEALLRWRHPQLGLVPPQQFVHVAELSGLIDRLGEWVLRKVCHQIITWKRAGMRAVPVSVNIGRGQMLGPGFSGLIAEILEETGVSADLLELELPEKVLLDCDAEACRNLAELHAMGCRMVVDDFGSTKFSLADLVKYGFGSVKIDRGLIRGGRGRNLEKSFLQATVAMCRALQLRVGAKGIQTEGQHRFALSQQCDEAQGFLYSPPVEPHLIPGLQSLSALGASSGINVPVRNLAKIAS